MCVILTHFAQNRPISTKIAVQMEIGVGMGMFRQFRPHAAIFPRLLTRTRTKKNKTEKKWHEIEITGYTFSMETEKSNATARTEIPRFNDEQKEFIKSRLIIRIPYGQVVDLFITVYPDFRPEGVDLAYYEDRLYQRILNHATNPNCPMSQEVKAAHTAQDERIANLAYTDKYQQLVTLCNYIKREWRPRTFVKTATDSQGNEHDIYRDNIGQLIQCFKAINKLTAELGLASERKAPKESKPLDRHIVQAQAAGAPSLTDEPPTNEFPSFAGPPPEEEEDSELSKKNPIIKL